MPLSLHLVMCSFKILVYSSKLKLRGYVRNGRKMQMSDSNNALVILYSLQDLTQFNTAHNKQISMVGISENDMSHKRKRHSLSISFANEEEVINPEDIDPTIGRFRNMVQTTVIPSKVQCAWVFFERLQFCLFVFSLLFLPSLRK